MKNIKQLAFIALVAFLAFVIVVVIIAFTATPASAPAKQAPAKTEQPKAPAVANGKDVASMFTDDTTVLLMNLSPLVGNIATASANGDLTSMNNVASSLDTTVKTWGTKWADPNTVTELSTDATLNAQFTQAQSDTIALIALAQGLSHKITDGTLTLDDVPVAKSLFQDIENLKLSLGTSQKMIDNQSNNALWATK